MELTPLDTKRAYQQFTCETTIVVSAPDAQSRAPRDGLLPCPVTVSESPLWRSSLGHRHSRPRTPHRGRIVAPKGLTDALTAALPRAFHLIKKVALEASNTFARRRRRWGCFVIDLGTGTGMGRHEHEQHRPVAPRPCHQHPRIVISIITMLRAQRGRY